MAYDLVVKGGRVVTATKQLDADVAVVGQHIAAIGPGLDGRQLVDATGKLVIPGGVDIHVHHELKLPDYTSADTFFTGTRAAALGGTTTIVDFVDPLPEQALPDALAARRAKADPQVVIDYGLHMTLTPHDMKKLDQVAAAYEAGCATFKLYMAYGYRLHDGELLRSFQAIRGAGGRAVIHAENWDVICTLVAQNLAAGRREPLWHPRSRPAPLEGEAVGRVIDIAAYTGLPIHIFHVSCAAAAERISAAQDGGLPVTGETCPQYLLLTETAYEAPGLQGALPVCAPPLRPASDRAALWTAVAGGTLSIISTDHCPFTLADKERGRRQDFSRIPGGVPSIEMRMGAIYSAGVLSGRLTPEQWVDRCCTTPARLAGLPGKGRIEIGADADIVVFDPSARRTLSPDVLHENIAWTPYDGLEVSGWPEVTISRGEVIVQEGRFMGDAGRGRFIRRSFNGD